MLKQQANVARADILQSRLRLPQMTISCYTCKHAYYLRFFEIISNILSETKGLSDGYTRRRRLSLAVRIKLARSSFASLESR
jgi:hypothetical protein